MVVLSPATKPFNFECCYTPTNCKLLPGNDIRPTLIQSPPLSESTRPLLSLNSHIDHLTTIPSVRLCPLLHLCSFPPPSFQRSLPSICPSSSLSLPSFIFNSLLTPQHLAIVVSRILVAHLYLLTSFAHLPASLSPRTARNILRSAWLTSHTLSPQPHPVAQRHLTLELPPDSLCIPHEMPGHALCSSRVHPEMCR